MVYGLDESAVSRTDPSVPHYHGDMVRLFLLGAGVLILLTTPFYVNLLPYNVTIEVGAAIAVVVFAALTNPYKRWVIGADAIIAIVGIVAFELAAISAYLDERYILFALREGLALLFLFALYFSVRTFRAMTLRQIKLRRSDSR